MTAKYFAIFFLLVITIFLSPDTLIAEGTPSGTNIVNQATVTYRIDSTNFVINSNVSTTRVVELLDVSVQWQDATQVIVNPGDTAEVITFVVTNSGNGNDSYYLENTSRLDGDDFDPILREIFLDTDSDGLYDPTIDRQYIRGANDPVLDADQSIIVFALNDIPSGLLDGSLGNTRLRAISTVGTGSPGAVFTGAGDFGLDAVLGSSGGADNDLGTYLVSNVSITLVKSVEVRDASGGSKPVTGATLSYTITVTASGSGSARSVIITDSIPENTSFVSGTLTLNSIPLTDESDGDAGDVNQTAPGVVTVQLGEITIPAREQIITFDVIIN
ncbi:MAG: DUF11 domain-containing protein [candidate division Zixibacteria bacterium]|nr:DUF11 domain-containing protein [candidate division Zixibacteria bacterium]NIS17028.1 DUF11 domain-containing protein [candidate division Zixibacteria bacterium]NIS49025.1 DUF11 domain-containing protein [candidate division Zixibacteria bacterium]NIT53401.1 DUF11 domain-containing protein [candidate division Zixibacteria bacterium]NIU17111.1 DUF11 domain-containing protein [candidate division Zixibacteria bacterium]